MAKSTDVNVRFLADASNLKKGLSEVEAASAKAGGSSGLGGLQAKIPGLNKALGTDIPEGTQAAGLGLDAVGTAAAGGAIAIGAFALKGVGDFRDLGVEIGKSSDATGISTEQTSRLVEVFKDAGLSTEDLTNGLGKMEKAAGKTPKVFADLGIAIAKTKDGQIDANQTFLNAVDVLNAIQDPNVKAAEATKVFGKSWANMSELIARGSPQLKKDLEAVQPEKIFTSKDVESARGVRNAYDTIRDASEGLFLTIGKELAPAITDLATTLGHAVTAAGPFVKLIGDQLAAGLGTVGPLLKDVGAALGELGKAGEFVNAHDPLAWATGNKLSLLKAIQMGISGPLGLVSAFQDAITGSDGLEATLNKTMLGVGATDAAARAAANASLAMGGSFVTAGTNSMTLAEQTKATKLATDEATAASKARVTALQDEINQINGLYSTERAGIDSKYAYEKATYATATAASAYALVLKDNKSTYDQLHTAQQAAFDSSVAMSEAYVKSKGASLASASGTQMQIQQLQNLEGLLGPNDPLRAQINGYVADLQAIPRNVNTQLNLRVVGATVTAGGDTIGVHAQIGGPAIHGATGAVITRRTDGVTLGEAGPEAVIPLNTVPGASPIDGLFGGARGNTYNVTVNAGIGTSGPEVGRVVVDSIKQYERLNGPIFSNSAR